MNETQCCFSTADQHDTKENSDGSSLKPSRATSSRSPSYLYRRKNILYFRYVFTSEQQKLFGSSEIRISLKTGFLREARKKVRCIFAKLQEFSLKNEFIRMSDLRQSLSEMLESHEESASQEQRLSLAEIRRRMDDFRQKILELGDLKFYQPESPIDLSGGKPVPLMSPSQYLDCNLKLLLNVVNDKAFRHHQEIYLF